MFLAAENVTPPVALFAIQGQCGQAAAAHENSVAVMEISKSRVKPATPSGNKAGHSSDCLPSFRLPSAGSDRSRGGAEVKQDC